MKYTPGPWVARNATLPKSGVIRWVILETDNGFTLADTGSADTPKHQDEANAHLLAAAPDLLEACKAALEIRNKYGTSGAPVSKQLEAAIQKAEGK